MQKMQTEKTIQQLIRESPNMVRRRWPEYSSMVDLKSPEFDALWSRMCRRMEIQCDDYDVLRIKEFITEETDTELVFYGYSARQTENVKLICDKIGLVSASDGRSGDRRLVARMPPVWKWEYTEVPFVPFLEALYCNECSIVLPKRRLLCSIYYNFYLCQKCHDTKSDNRGDPYDSHKWEPM